MKQEDHQLVQEVLSGNQESFEILVNRYLTLAGSKAFQIIGDFHLASDIVQEAFVKAYRALNTLEDPAKFKSWLMGIVRTTSIDWLRKQKHHAPLDLQELGELFTSPQKSPEETFGEKEQAELIRQVLAELPEDYQEVLIWKHMEELSYQEIAHRLGTSINTVESRLFRARNLLKKKWDQWNKDKKRSNRSLLSFRTEGEDREGRGGRGI